MSMDKLAQIIQDLKQFSEHFLTIRTKSGAISPFIFNRAQLYLHQKLEEQLAKTGRVRAIILKGRQSGCSTYVQARFFHKVATTRGKKAFILTHEAEATKNLFDMTKRYCDGLPSGLIPKPDASSAKELNFKSLGSGYGVGTAGNKAVGRSQTVQLFHGSEVAYWPHAAEHSAGILQAVSNEPETEIILESTACGMGNFFHHIWQNAIAGNSDFQAIFIPWYWQQEYAFHGTDPLTDEEMQMFDMYAKNGLTLQHLYWRRKKIQEFGSDIEMAMECFNVEYPNTALQAFKNPIGNRFIKPEIVELAMKNTVKTNAHLVIGVDPAVSDNDRTAIIRRRGRRAYNLEVHKNLNTMEIVGVLRRIIDKEQPLKVIIDAIGVGCGVVDRLQELGYDCVEGINVAKNPVQRESYRNLRAELWGDMKEWLYNDLGVELPNSDELMVDLTSLGYKFDSQNRLQLESKQDLVARGGKSPDIADALAYTFYVGEFVEEVDNTSNTYYSENSRGLLV